MSAPILHMDSIYWNRLKQGDPQALGYLYDTYIDKMTTAAFHLVNDRELIKDAVQETFIELWNYRDTLGDIRHSQSYLVKVLRSIIIKKVKTDTQMHSITDEMELASEQNHFDSMAALENESEKNEKLKMALSQLTSRQKLIIRLRFFEGLSYDQIAEKLNMNYQSVNNLVFRTILSLRRQMNFSCIPSKEN